MKTNKLEFLILLFITILTGIFIYVKPLRDFTYSVTFHPAYIMAIFFAALFAFLAILKVRPFKIPHGRVGWLTNKVLFILFLPFVLFPVLFCYFKVPYLFCHVCPRRCIFGYIREYIVPFTLIVNIDKRFWCYNWCPVGKIHDSQIVLQKKFHIKASLLYLRLFMLVLIIVSYFFMLYSATTQSLTGSTFYIYMFKNTYTFSAYVFATTTIIFMLGFFIHRFFCNALCPVGVISDVVLKIQNPTPCKSNMDREFF